MSHLISLNTNLPLTLISYLNILDHELSNNKKPPSDSKSPLAPLMLNERWLKNDYQNALEKHWITDLRNKSAIEVNKKQLKKLIKYYKKR